MRWRLRQRSGISPLYDVKFASCALARRRPSPVARNGMDCSFAWIVGGARRDRTDDLKLAKLALSQLSYGPERSGALQERRSECSKPGPSQRMKCVVGLGRFELPTSRLSSARSNQLSYKPPVAVSYAEAASDGPSSSMEKEKRRRRCPANGPHRS